MPLDVIWLEVSNGSYCACCLAWLEPIPNIQKLDLLLHRLTNSRSISALMPKSICIALRIFCISQLAHPEQQRHRDCITDSQRTINPKIIHVPINKTYDLSRQNIAYPTTALNFVKGVNLLRKGCGFLNEVDFNHLKDERKSVSMLDCGYTRFSIHPDREWHCKHQIASPSI